MAARARDENRHHSVQFIVPCADVELVKSSSHKLNKLYRVQLTVEEDRSRDNHSRWISLRGEQNEETVKAKDYILALTSPERKTIMSHKELFPHTAGLDAEVVENIERDTAAVIRCSGQVLEIYGSDVTVTLAVSALENLAQSVPTFGESKISTQRGGGGKEGGGRGRLGGQPLAAPSVNRMPARNSAATSSAQVNPAARVGATSASPGMSSGLDKEEDIDDSALFATGTLPLPPSAGASSVPLSFLQDPPHPGRGSPPNYSGKVSPQMRAPPLPRNVVFDGPTEHSRHVEKVAERLTSTTIHMRPESLAGGPQEKGASEDKGKDYFRNLGTSVGYTGKEVEEALLYVNLDPQKYHMPPSEFLKMLKNIKEEKTKIMNPQPEAVVISSDEDLSPEKLRGQVRERSSYSSVVAQNRPAADREVPNTIAPGLTARDVVETNRRQEEMRKKFLAQSKEKGQQTVVQPQTTVVKQQHRSGGEPRPKSDMIVRRERRSSTPEASHTAPIPGSKRKQNFSDDEHQTCVLKPFGALSEGEGGCHSGDSPLQTPSSSKASQLRFIVIDANNVAFAHGKNKAVSCRGLKIAIDYFRKLGHEVVAFMPAHMQYRFSDRPDKKTVLNREILEELHKENLLHFTPARRVGQGRVIASYDDRYIVELAQKEDGVIVSNDQYRDLVEENPHWQKFIEDRLLQFNFVNDHFMLPQDPLGRYGPRLEEFLRKTPSSTKQPPPAAAGAANVERPEVDGPGGDYWPRPPAPPGQGRRQRLARDPPHHPGLPHHPVPLVQPPVLVQSRSRSPAVTEKLFRELKDIFPSPEQVDKIQEVLANHSEETDLNRLSNYCVSALNY